MGLYWDNGKENGNYWDYSGSIRIIGYILGLYWDNGKENGNYWDYRGSIRIIGYILGLYWDIEKKMETTGIIVAL